MADNTEINVGSGGDLIATDDVAGVKYPRSKLTLGADGAVEGDVSSTRPLPAVLRNSSGTEIGTAGAPARVDPTGTTAQPVTDNGGSLTVDGSVSVTGAVPLPTGAATETTLGGVLKEGTDITGATLPTGGASGRGWLSAIWKALADRLPSALVSGRLDVNVGNTPNAAVTSVPADPFGANADASVSAGASGSISAKLRRLSADLGTLLGQLPGALVGGRLDVNVGNSPVVDTELPAAAALADAAANPTAPAVGAYNLGWNGATWDRLLLNSSKFLRVETNENRTNVAGADAQADSAYYKYNGTLLPEITRPTLFNGTSWDRARGNVEGTLLSSSSRSSTTASSDQTNYNGRGAVLFLHVTANPGGAETLTVELQVKDPVSGTYTTITAFAVSVTAANGDDVLTIFPGAAETGAVTGHQAQALILPRTWRARVVHSGAGAWTYSLGYAVVN